MRMSPPVPRTLLALCALIGLLAALAATTGLLWQGTDAGSALTVTSVRGQTVQLVGEGLYRYDSLLAGAGFRGVDVVVLVIGLPLLAVSAWLAGRESLRGRLLLVGTLGFFLYQYASMALGAAYNELFLVYIVLFSASLFAFVLAYATIDRDKLATILGLAGMVMGAVLLRRVDGSPIESPMRDIADTADTAGVAAEVLGA